jgi:hypothetical protein
MAKIIAYRIVERLARRDGLLSFLATVTGFRFTVRLLPINPYAIVQHIAYPAIKVFEISIKNRHSDHSFLILFI